MSIINDPRFVAGKRMRRAGRFEQAVQLLTEVMVRAIPFCLVFGG